MESVVVVVVVFVDDTEAGDSVGAMIAMTFFVWKKERLYHQKKPNNN
jgi:hypothetical protein